MQGSYASQLSTGAGSCSMAGLSTEARSGTAWRGLGGQCDRQGEGEGEAPFMARAREDELFMGYLDLARQDLAAARPRLSSAVNLRRR